MTQTVIEVAREHWKKRNAIGAQILYANNWILVIIFLNNCICEKLRCFRGKSNYVVIAPKGRVTTNSAIAPKGREE